MDNSNATTAYELIEQGLAAFGIDADREKATALASFVNELERWNRRMNLAGIKTIPTMVTHLIYDALFLFTRTRDCTSLLDIGSGAGVVAIPLSILDGNRTVYSVDKSLRKIQFQRHVKRVLGLSRLEVLHGRIEEIEPLRVDCALAKAFGSIPDILHKVARHVKEDGWVCLARGRNDRAAEVPGFLLHTMQYYELPKTDKEYQLFVYKKIS